MAKSNTETCPRCGSDDMVHETRDLELRYKYHRETVPAEGDYCRDCDEGIHLGVMTDVEVAIERMKKRHIEEQEALMTAQDAFYRGEHDNKPITSYELRGYVRGYMLSRENLDEARDIARKIADSGSEPVAIVKTTLEWVETVR